MPAARIGDQIRIPPVEKRGPRLGINGDIGFVDRGVASVNPRPAANIGQPPNDNCHEQPKQDPSSATMVFPRRQTKKSRHRPILR